MMSSTTPLNLQVTVSMSPFAVVIDSVTYGAKLTNPPVAFRPFDLLITCGMDNFQVVPLLESCSKFCDSYFLKSISFSLARASQLCLSQVWLHSC